MQQDQDQFMRKLREDHEKHLEDTATKLTELELKHNTDVPGSVV